jgi:nanoRNase/pAp phosphatase (c-di-AMP/oligoRNAs hydrolase)
MTQERLELLFDAVGRASNLLILPHNNPDPDAIASAVALRYLLAKRLGVESQIAYKGIIGRAENRALVRYLSHPLRRLTASDLHSTAPIALVDTQPGAGNNPLPPQSNVAIVIDHHPWREAAAGASFVDVRPSMGSTATILTEYLQAAGLVLEPLLATALFYGIKTDTMGLERGASSGDNSAFCYLLPQIDIEALFKIERAQVPIDYFKSFAATLQGARIYDDVALSYVGLMGYPDLTAEMADFLLRMQGVKWVICLGVHKNNLILSVRTINRRGAGQLVQKIVGDRGTAGGHGALAGGQIPLKGQDPEQLVNHLKQQTLQYFKVSPAEVGKPLI